MGWTCGKCSGCGMDGNDEICLSCDGDGVIEQWMLELEN